MPGFDPFNNDPNRTRYGGYNYDPKTQTTWRSSMRPHEAVAGTKGSTESSEGMAALYPKKNPPMNYFHEDDGK